MTAGRGGCSFRRPHSVAENAGLMTIKVQRVGGSNGVVMVDYATSNGTATAGSDYTAKSGTLMWGNGDSANKTFNVPITNDAAVESATRPSTSRFQSAIWRGPGQPGHGGGDHPRQRRAGTPGILRADLHGERGSGSAQITVNRIGGRGGAISVQFNTSNGTATAGADYTATSLTLNWANGDAGPGTYSCRSFPTCWSRLPRRCTSRCPTRPAAPRWATRMPRRSSSPTTRHRPGAACAFPPPPMWSAKRRVTR
ncbi:MAG: hypothetical protein IPM02_21570 [Betaproteobacteria bacterium]|nr:hypothetical protein [Betaproteobacteria bacterium]